MLKFNNKNISSLETGYGVGFPPPNSILSLSFRHELSCWIIKLAKRPFIPYLHNYEQV